MENTSPDAFITPGMAQRFERCTAKRKANYAAAYASLHPSASATSLETGGGLAVYIAPSSPVNGVAGLGLERPVTPADLDCIEAFFDQRGAIPQVQVCPLADPGLIEQLSARGYSISHFFSVLVRALPAGFQPGPLAPGLEITRALPQDAGLWLATSASGFEGSEQIPPETYDILSPNFYAPASTCYLAWIDGQCAAAGGMYLSGGVAELGGASTRPAFRRRGAQRGLIETRLADAFALGCDYAMILTEPGSDSQRNAQRAGFWLAYTCPVMRKGQKFA